MSRLKELLEKKTFVVTAECGPPKGADRGIIEKKGGFLKGYVDAVNVTDNQTSIVRMSSIASCAILKGLGIEPIMQMTTRDRNRIAIQSDIFGAYALGIENILCLSGDHQKFGNHPQARNVFDLDSVQLIQTVKIMRDEGKVLGGDSIEGIPKMFIGAVENPFADPFEFRLSRLSKKIRAGAEFIQTQCIFNLEKFKRFMEGIVEKGLSEKAYILAGITPLKSAAMANYIKNSVAGMDVPDEIITRLKGVAKEKQKEEGIEICVETIEEIKKIEGIAGIHIMAIEWEEVVPFIVKRANLKISLP
ncbi:MAG: methylenetetrahydrofolate reductase [bacterium]